MSDDNFAAKIRFGLKNIMTFRTIYNNLCRSCKLKLLRTVNKKDKLENNNERMEKAMENLCKPCNKKVKEIVERSGK